jgi:hypothetical protein
LWHRFSQPDPGVETFRNDIDVTALSGYRRRNFATMGRRIWCAARSFRLMRSVPVGVSRNSFTSSNAPAISRSAGLTRARKRSPASDNETLRVVRLMRRTPSRFSSPVIAWLNAEGEMPSSIAAARKLRCAEIAATAFNSKRPVCSIVRYLASGHAILCRLLHQSTTLY